MTDLPDAPVRVIDDEPQMCDPQLASIPVIVLSAAGRFDVTAAAEPLRAVAGMEKPVDWDELLRLVQEYCQRPTMH